MPAHTLSPLPIPSGVGAPSAFPWARLWQAFLRRVAGLGVDVFSVRLAAGQGLQLHEVAGWTVVCRSGAVWLTQEGDTRDIFLKGGEGFALDRGGLALVRACQDGMLSILAPVGRRPGRSERIAGGTGPDCAAADARADLNWLKSLYPECGPWSDPASYRRAGLL